MTLVKFASTGKNQNVTISFDCNGKRYSYVLGGNGKVNVTVDSDKIVMTPKTKHFIKEGIITFSVASISQPEPVKPPTKKKRTPKKKKSVKTTATKNWREDK